ncbi:MAG: hypothetical protein ACOYEV_00380 [Candidatus Nanopelagicales bacterium]
MSEQPDGPTTAPEEGEHTAEPQPESQTPRPGVGSDDPGEAPESGEH